MNLTWHIVKKDLRALRWPIGVWLLCIIAKLLVGVLMLNAGGEEDAEWFKQMENLAMALATGEVLSFVLVAAMIQEDLMVGTTAFWMTRPISGARLLQAKLLGIGLVFLVAPVLVTLPWWIGCDYGLDEIAWAAAETFAVHALVVLAALLWSAVTDGLGRFVMWTLVTLTVTPMLTAIVSYYVRHGRTGPVPELVSTRMLLALGIVAVGTCVVLVHQYLTRHTWRSIAVIGVTMGLATLTLALWPWAWNFETRLNGYLVGRAAGEWSAADEPPGLKYTLTGAEFSGRRDRPSRAGTLVTRHRVEGLEESQGFIGYNSQHTWRWPDGTTEKGVAIGRSMLNGLAFARANEFVSGKYVAPPDTDQLSITSLLPSATMEKVRAQPPDYTLNARLRMMKYVGTNPVAAQRGAWQKSGMVAERIAAAEKSGEQLLVTFIQHAPSLWVDKVGGGRTAMSGDFSRYFLVNRRNGFVDAGASEASRTATIATVAIHWRSMSFRGTATGGGRKASLDAINALNEAELIKVTFTEQARFTHEFQLDAARIAEANP